MWDFTDYKEDQVEYVEGVHPELRVKIASIKHHFDNKNQEGKKSPYTNVCFKVMDGEHKDKLLNERFYCAARFKMAWLTIACGIYMEVQNDDGKTIKVVPSTFNDPMTLAKRELYISTKKSIFNPKYTEIDNMSADPLVAVSKDEKVAVQEPVY